MKTKRFKLALKWSYELFGDPLPYITNDKDHVYVQIDAPTLLVRNAYMLAEMLTLSVYVDNGQIVIF